MLSYPDDSVVKARNGPSDFKKWCAFVSAALRVRELNG